MEHVAFDVVGYESVVVGKAKWFLALTDIEPPSAQIVPRIREEN